MPASQSSSEVPVSVTHAPGSEAPSAQSANALHAVPVEPTQTPKPGLRGEERSALASGAPDLADTGVGSCAVTYARGT